MATSELSVLLTAKGNLEGELKTSRDRVKELSKEIRNIQASGGTVGEDLAAEFRQATQAADKLSRKLSDVNRDVKKTASESQSAASKVGRAWSKAATVFSNDLAAGLSAAGLLVFGKRAVDTFAQVQDAQSALSATFGAQGDALTRWAQASGDALNLSQREALNAAQTFAIFGQSAGLSGKQLETFTTDLATRAADLASYFGGSTQAAVDALSSGLAGQSEVLRRYGIFVDDAALKSQALAMGIYAGSGQLTAQQKLLATQAIILRDSARAQGDVARTSDSMANQLKDTSQQLEDFRSTAGETIAMALNPLLKLANRGARLFGSMPEPMRQAAIAVGLLGSAALIATPRIVALNAALSARGGLMGVAVAGKRAAIGIGAVTAALVGFQAIKSATGGGVRPFGSWYDGTVGLSNAMRDLSDRKTEVSAALQGFTSAAGVFLPITSQSDQAAEAVSAFDSQLVSLVSMGKLDEARRKVDDLARETKAYGGGVDFVKAQLPGYTSAMEAATAVTGDMGNAAGEAADEVSGLSRALGRLGKAAALQRAKAEFRKAIRDGIAKPSKDAAYSAIDAFGQAFSSYKEGGKAQAKFVRDNYADMRGVIARSGLSDTAQRQLLAPLEAAKAEADKVLAALDSINGRSVSATVILNKLNSPGMDPIRRATGGPIWGPGTATSDSVPALLSNGEYVLRAKAVSQLGMGTLDRLNQTGDLGSVATLDRTQPAPLVGSLNLTVNNPQQTVDVEKAAMRALSRVERIRRERS